MSNRLRDRVAVVTGGGGGIGEAVCHRFAEAGADVVAVDVDGDTARSTAERIETETGRTAIGVETDVSDEAQVEAMADIVDERFDRVDVLVNNAGIRVDPTPVTEATEEMWDRILGVNLKGYAFCAKHLIPLMSDGGSIVNVASEGAEVARRNWSLYDSTKGAIISMTQDMACDHAEDDIRVNAVSPGWVITDFHLPEEDPDGFFEEKTSPHADGPGILKRAGAPRELANGILFLASDEASFVTGANFRIDGGKTAVGHDIQWESLVEGEMDSTML
jgi:NAD(P)-dependent dehydrogenase (short-subunit alcohol dehydrogenase family)